MCELRPLGDILGLQAFDKDRMALGTTWGEKTVDQWAWTYGRVLASTPSLMVDYIVDDSIYFALFCPLSGIAAIAYFFGESRISARGLAASVLSLPAFEAQKRG